MRGYKTLLYSLWATLIILTIITFSLCALGDLGAIVLGLVLFCIAKEIDRMNNFTNRCYQVEKLFQEYESTKREDKLEKAKKIIEQL